MTTFTFLATGQSLESISKAYQESLGEVIVQVQEKQGAYVCTLHDDSVLTISTPETGNTPEGFFLLQEKWGEFFGSRETEHKEIQKSLLEQIKRWDTMVEVQFVETENEDRTACIFGSLLVVAEQLQGFILTEELTLYNSQADIVFDEEGYSDLEEFELV